MNDEIYPRKYERGKARMTSNLEDDVFGVMNEEISEEKTYGAGKKYGVGNENVSGGMGEEILEPKKYDPTKKNRCSEEDVFTRYQSIAARNPFEASATYRERLANKETYFPPKSTVKASSFVGDPLESGIEWTVPPQRAAPLSFQTRLPSQQRSRAEDGNPYSYERAEDPEDTIAPHVEPLRIHKRSVSNPQASPSLDVTPPQDLPPMQLRHKISKSLSDPTLLHQNPPAVDSAIKRKPTPIITSPYRPSIGLSDRDRLSTITEQEDLPDNYKLQVSRNLGSPTKITRSPLKKFFGDGGLLGRSPSKKDKPDPKFKKTGFSHWTSKVKQYISDVGKEISDSVPRVELIPKRSLTSVGPSQFPVSLSPYEQGNFYFQLELMLNNETNKFISTEFEANRVTAESVRKVAEEWANKGRPQILAFRYDISTQRDLVLFNCNTMHFSGINAFNRIKMIATLAAWKILAKEISVHTFCHPDSAVKKHLFDAERVLEIIDASATSMLAFQDMRSNILGIIYREEKYKRDKEAMNGKEVAWTPSKFDNGESF